MKAFQRDDERCKSLRFYLGKSLLSCSAELNSKPFRMRALKRSSSGLYAKSGGTAENFRPVIVRDFFILMDLLYKCILKGMLGGTNDF